MQSSSVWVTRNTFCCNLFLIVLFSPITVLADTSLVATGNVSAGYTTNILGVPEDNGNNPNVVPVEADGFMNLNPGLSAAYDRPRSVHNLFYIFGARLFAKHSEANSYSNTLNYLGVFTLSPRSVINGGASFNSGRINNFDRTGGDTVGQGDVVQNGDVEFISYNANAAYRLQINRLWTANVSINAGKFTPTNVEDDAGNTTTAGNQYRLERRSQYHLIGTDIRLSYAKQTAPPLIQKTMTTGAGIFWTWDVTDSISTNTSAGLDIVGLYPDLADKVYVPRVGAALTYSHERGRATAGWARGVQASLFGGQTTITNQFFVNVGMPIPTERPMAIALAAAYSSGQQLNLVDDAVEEVAGETRRISGDMTLSYEVNQAWNVAIRAATSKQFQIDVSPAMTPDIITRQTTVTLVLTGRFPTRMAAQIPRASNDRVNSGNQAVERSSSSGGGNGGGGNGGGGNGSGGQQQ